MQKTVLLFLNGDCPKNIPDISMYAIICATDGAYEFLKEVNITPNFISGDFDSIKAIPKDIKTNYTPDQNFTDFDKIVNILFEQKYTDIHVYGASGGEQDHFLGNIHTAIFWKEKVNLTFFDAYGFYFVAKPYTKIHDCLAKTISLVPFSAVTNITTSGLQYALEHEDLVFGKRIGTRNKANHDTVEISFDSGDLLIFVYH